MIFFGISNSAWSFMIGKLGSIISKKIAWNFICFSLISCVLILYSFYYYIEPGYIWAIPAVFIGFPDAVVNVLIIAFWTSNFK